MTDWAEGYVADVAYTAGFYRELSPRFLTYVGLLQRARVPDIGKPFRYCELGCGQGVSTTVLAALYPHAQFTGIDFNPAHIASARSLAAEGELDNVAFREESFLEALEQDDAELPQQDFITLHGTYTYVSRENRRAIVDFIRRKLRPGGLVFVSYKTMPGWLQMMPLQRLMHEHAARHPDASHRQLDAAMHFIDSLAEADTRFFETNQAATERMKKLREKDKRYLTHEFMPENWEPIYHTDLVREMGEAKLDYVGSAGLLDNFAALSLPEKTREIHDQTADPAFREVIKDFATNQQFRRDVLVKGRQALTGPQERRELENLTFLPLRTAANMSTEFRTPLGRATGQASIYQPIIDAVSQGATKLGDLMAESDARTGQLVQASAALTQSGQIHPVVGDRGGTAVASARRLNRAMAQRALDGEGYGYLAAPAIGNGVPARDHEIVAFDVLSRHEVRTAEELAQGMLARFKRVGRRLVKDGRTLETDEENLAEFRAHAETIMRDRVPVWRQLRIL
mgnify:CR=1 FL=1